MAPLVGDTCVEECGLYQTIDENKCHCQGGLEVKGSECAVPEGKTWADFADVCVAAKRVVNLTGDECVTGCNDKEMVSGKQCVCDQDSILYEDKTHCVANSGCKRTFSDDGVLVCLAATICTGNLKL